MRANPHPGRDRPPGPVTDGRTGPVPGTGPLTDGGAGGLGPGPAVRRPAYPWGGEQAVVDWQVYPLPLQCQQRWGATTPSASPLLPR